MPTETNEHVQRRVAEELERFFAHKRREFGDRRLRSVLPVLCNFTLASKHIRSLFCYWGWRGARPGPSEPDRELISTCAALELLHAGLLVHDDIVDGDDTRRGQPTVRRSFADISPHPANANRQQRTGDDAALLAGDVLLTWSAELLHSIDTSHSRKDAMMAHFYQMCNAVTLGQLTEAFTPVQGSSLADALEISRLKTSSYSIEGPLALGGVLAGAAPEVLDVYQRFGRGLGEAIQLLDDVVDAFSGIEDSTRVTPEVIAELRQPKPSSLILAATERAQPHQAARIARLYGDPYLDEAGAAELQQVIIATGARTAMEEMHRQRLATALETLRELPDPGEACHELTNLAKMFAGSLIRHADSVPPAGAAGDPPVPSITFGLTSTTGPADYAPNVQVLKARIEQSLEKFIEEQIQVIDTYEKETLFGLLRPYLLEGGKRLRPIFCYWGWRGAGGEDNDQIVRVASTIELFHHFAASQDDVMDESAFRWGRPTLHRTLADLHSKSDWMGDSDKFGASIAIILGDLCLTWADDLFHNCGLPPERLFTAWPIYQSMRREALIGQYLDVASVTRDPAAPPRLSQALKAIRYKSVGYTIKFPLLLGGTLAGAPSKLLDTYSEFGLPFGEAFQLRDDLFGAFGDPRVTGKPNLDDFRAGKETALIALAVERANPAQAKVITRLYGKPDLGDADAETLREVLAATGAADAVEAMISERTDSALRILAEAPVERSAASALRDLTLACAWRES
ncbi:polyprenyl synthetase family protein [Amycolatopsis alba]|uniref:Polyprenyl synthetase n=1 Tax=Amycolatopsis alba DSM 44262 TaxID=1125972 RepID=A0A229RLT5_AMYAL|nr:polyprenyl synthetase family protein [Amycolatopsis alba]OXM47384.1 hypothetical protein CFP75_24420 [Amycolatopsis alba DSM 44262]